MTWAVALVEEVDEWFADLDEATANLVAAAIDQLEEKGPALARPLADHVKGSKLHKMKELRPGSAGASEVRILFCFDSERQAVLLVAGAGKLERLVQGGNPASRRAKQPVA